MKKLDWKKILISLLALAFCLSGCGTAAGPYFARAEEGTQAGGGTEAHGLPEEEETEEGCFVYVCGAVKSPGVYQVPAGSRIYEAIRLAGGLREDACAESVNQAEEVLDGQMIQIPSSLDLSAEGEALAGGESDGKVNLNTADETDLMALPGIGASKAKSILSYRQERGKFGSIEEIMNITGIKEGVFSKIKDYITVN